MNKKYLLAIAACSVMLAACGDEVTEINEIHQDGMAVLEAGEKLSKQACDTTNVGEMLFVMDSSAAFVCDGKSWQTLKGEKGEDGGKGNPGKDGDNGSGCTSKSVKNAAGLEGLEVTCGETVIDTVWNGKDGENGKPGDPGKPGEAGTSCTAKSVKNAAGLEGLEVTCDNAVIDTIWNGKNGKDGEDGNDGTSCTAEPVTAENGRKGVKVTCGGDEVGTIWDGTNGSNGTDGAGCSLEDNGEGAVSVTCGEGEGATTTTIFKAMCGTKPYDPAKSFCSEGEVYDLCDGKTYDPAKSFCSEGELYSCNDKPYDPAKSFCSEGELYSCNGKPYDPAKSFCSEGKVYDLCDGKTYDPAKSFCLEGELYSCNDKPYDPAKSFCSDDKLYSCNDKPYDPAKSFCSEGKLYSCNDKPYDPKKQYCKLGATVEDYGWLTDSRDKHVYKTVEICNTDKSVCQTWMAENLNYDPGDVSAMGEYAWSGNYGYGRLYTWEVAVDNADCAYGKTCTLPTVVQGVCPSGWHLPTNAEWNTLFTAVGGAGIAAKMLKSQTGWNYNGNGEDAYGFSALPAGHIHDGHFGSTGAYFWSAQDLGDNNAHYIDLLPNYENAHLNSFYKRNACSVRCLQNN